jgi:hypothetical protein
VAGTCGHDNASLVFVNGWEFLDQLSDSQLLKKLVSLSREVMKCLESSL